MLENEEILSKLKNLKIAVFGDYYLDDYFWIDAALNEASLETGLIAYQCIKQEAMPGASGNISKNLANLGVGKVYAVGYTGNDGRGLEMCQGLDKMGVDREYMVTFPGRVTPTHTKPWLIENDQTRELNRIDIKNWDRTPQELENEVFAGLEKLIGNIDALIILDHAAEENCGIITDTVRCKIDKLIEKYPQLIVYADSRSRIGLFEGMMVKGNQFELCHAIFGHKTDKEVEGVRQAADPSVERTESEINEACSKLAKRNKRPVICTMGERGARIYTENGDYSEFPAYKVPEQTDVTGAGDMFTSAFISTLAAGADISQATAFGNAAAALCVSQLGTSGHVTAEDLLKKVNE